MVVILTACIGIASYGVLGRTHFGVSSFVRDCVWDQDFIISEYHHNLRIYFGVYSPLCFTSAVPLSFS